MVPLENHTHVRSKTLSGSPKKNAALFGSAKKTGGKRGGAVPTYQSSRNATKRSSCHTLSQRLLELAGIAFQHFLAHGMPNEAVQLDEAGRQPDLCHVARPRQVDGELADRMRLGAGRKNQHPIRERDRLL